MSVGIIDSRCFQLADEHSEDMRSWQAAHKKLADGRNEPLNVDLIRDLAVVGLQPGVFDRVTV